MLSKELEAYAVEAAPKTLELLRELCAIPAPSHHEELRAEFVKKWFEENGGENVTVDAALNVICPVNVTENNDLVVIMAHTDTVFPDRTPYAFREDEEKVYCPAVCDDTGNLSVLLLAARYFLTKKITPKTGILFVANSCEEGLGDLKGSKQIVKNYGQRIKEFISFDGEDFGSIVSEAVGSHRYKVKVKTEGGHSFGAFGNRNAIRCLASMIETFYSVKVPVEGKSRTTYNVGTISGGTSVNTIAQEAEMLYEYRSDNRHCLSKMQDIFEKVIEAYRATGIEVEVEKVGDRPCTGEVDEGRMAALHEKIFAANREIGEESFFRSGSTDANIPLSQGIPAATIGVVIGEGCHTREEWLDKSSVLPGLRKALSILSNYYEV